jgi:hypothetical protein
MCALICAGMLGTRGAYADTASNSVLGMFPKQVVEFAFIDFSEARKFPWFDAARKQLMPQKFSQFSDFLGSVGMDPRATMQQLYWGTVAVPDGGPQVLGVASGQFTPDATESKLDSEKVPSEKLHGFNLYAFGTGSGESDILFTFIDDNTVAFGELGALKELIDVRMAAADSLFLNNKMYALINATKGGGAIWSVFDQEHARQALQQLIPGYAQFPQVGQLQNRINAMTLAINSDAGSNTEITSQVTCDSSADASVMAAALQAALLYRRYQVTDSNPQLAVVLNQTKVTPRGDRLQLDVTLSGIQLQSLVFTQ